MRRSGAGAAFVMSDLKGIITFPSFHTSLGILLVYAYRGHRTWLAGSIALNGLMILSVPSEGGHYLAGAAVAVLAIAAVRMAEMRWADRSAAASLRRER
jgi:hypothetical protein